MSCDAAITSLNPPRTPGEQCKDCYRAVVVGFRVADEVWAAVVGNPGAVLCVMCFDERAHELGIPYAFLEVRPVAWSAWEAPS